MNGWTTPGSDELKRIMMKHGGVYHHYYNSQKTTHIIASNLPGIKRSIIVFIIFSKEKNLNCMDGQWSWSVIF